MASVQYGAIERSLIFAHRWVGIVLALLMALWSVSGIVMLYVAFPELTEAEHYAGLERLDLRDCCASATGTALDGTEQIVISMMAGKPVARVGSAYGEKETFDLVSGSWLESVPQSLAEAVAASHLAALGLAAPVAETTTIHNDQWTVYQRFHAHRPLYKVTFDSGRGDSLYVSGTSAEIVQDTHARERFWNWFGAIPHWLYYTAFRERQAIWYQFVVYTSAFGTLLVLSGLYLGIKRTLAADGRWTRYLGPMRWHHVTGLIFGALTLTWVVSGLLSMNPWGWLEDPDTGEELARLELTPLDSQKIAAILQLAAERLDEDTVSLTISSGDGTAIVYTADSDGHRKRRDASTFAIDTIDKNELVEQLAQRRPDADIRQLVLLEEEDAYYFGHKSEVRLPVYRTILDDEKATRYYFDAETGELVSRVDRAGKLYRWLHYGLHRLDFSALLRSRPLWDIVILPLLLGVTGLCLIGCWIGYRHLCCR